MVRRCGFPGCRRKGLTRHHIKPKSHGGRGVGNYVRLCPKHQVWVHQEKNEDEAVRMGLLTPRGVPANGTLARLAHDLNIPFRKEVTQP